MANTTIYPYGTNGQLPSSIGVINDLTTGGADKALSAEMGKEMGETVYGKQDVTGVWSTGGYQFNGAVGGTFAGTVTTVYPYAQQYKYCKLEVVNGDKIHVKAQHNGGYYTVVIVDSEGKVLQLSGKGAVDSDYNITADGFVYITNKTDTGTPSAVIYGTDGHTQFITALQEDVAELKETVDSEKMDAQINGRDIRVTFYDDAYYNSGSATVGSTFNPSRTSYTGYKCVKQEVRAGDKVIVAAMGSAYQFPVIITDSNNVVTALEPKNTFVNKTITIEDDGYIFINNTASSVQPICHIYNASAKQMAESVMATLPDELFIEGKSTTLPIISGKFPYPNQNTYFMLLNSPGNGCTPWLAMPHGTYIIPTINVTIYQADKPLFENDYAKINDNIWSKSLTNGGVFEVEYDYVMFAFAATIPSSGVSVYCDKVTSTAAAKKHVSHVSHVANGDIVFYLPLRDKYYCFVLKYYQAANQQLEHYGISGTYLCDSSNFVYPQTLLTRASEYECAMDIQGQGYLGGHMHGYEQMVAADTTIYLNGQSKTLADAFGEDVTGMFEMMQHSVLYKTDKTTKVADIYKRWRVVDNKLHMYNRVVFAASYHINRGQFSMFGIYRHEGGSTSNPYLTCFASRNSDTRVYQTTDGWDTSSPTDGASIISTPAKATLQEQWGESGYIVRQEIFENNQKENGGMFINTNGGGEYNKMYFEIGSNFDVVEGDELFSHAVLSIE